MTPRPSSLRERDYQALAELRHRLRLFLAFSERASKTAGLEPRQHQLLLAVRGFGTDSPTVGTLADRLVLRHHSTVELCDRLEKRGLIRRVRSDEDRRQARVRLTLAGRRILERLTAAHREELRRAGPNLVAALTRVLGDVR